MANKSILDLDYAKYDFKDPEKFVFKSEKGLSRQTVEQISDMKKEPEWMKKFRLRAYEHFLKRPMPTWGGNLSHIDFNDIYYYLDPPTRSRRAGTMSLRRSRRHSIGSEYPRPRRSS